MDPESALNNCKHEANLFTRFFDRDQRISHICFRRTFDGVFFPVNVRYVSLRENWSRENHVVIEDWSQRSCVKRKQSKGGFFFEHEGGFFRGTKVRSWNGQCISSGLNGRLMTKTEAIAVERKISPGAQKSNFHECASYYKSPITSGRPADLSLCIAQVLPILGANGRQEEMELRVANNIACGDISMNLREDIFHTNHTVSFDPCFVDEIAVGTSRKNLINREMFVN